MGRGPDEYHPGPVQAPTPSTVRGLPRVSASGVRTPHVLRGLDARGRPRPAHHSGVRDELDPSADSARGSLSPAHRNKNGIQDGEVSSGDRGDRHVYDDRGGAWWLQSRSSILLQGGRDLHKACGDQMARGTHMSVSLLPLRERLIAVVQPEAIVE